MEKIREIDEQYMRQALSLARMGYGAVEPNPMVGCVIVRDGVVVGRGFHRKFGGDHAEIDALREAGDKADGATCYVTLEPCSHYGKTPPCTSALIRAKLVRIVVAMEDPFPKVHGNGINELRAAGIEVEVGLLENEARQLNATYLLRVNQSRPLITAKWAMSLDGKIATRTGAGKWISCERSREIVQDLRKRSSAIMIGIGTVLADDPLLTVRNIEKMKHHPLRVVLDSQLKLPLNSKLVQTSEKTPLMLVVSEAAAAEHTPQVEQLENAGVKLLRYQSENGEQHPPMEWVLEQLFEQYNIGKLLVEGGANVLGKLFDANLIDEVHVFIATKLLGGERAKSPIAGIGIEQMQNALRLENPKIEIIEKDIYVHGSVVR
ncbi:MAG: bifunctional diaminohydroxyphosphoribosylaminopyrimidine deaminase/5-amino-6-(5-phosphoribosylamino)uracil reductase RibD [Planctomycetaceae bacterium]|nr:bifunctional diaminohydroxyphosphoribosylaminopyrimidine deaminase/5-amino-6-(5-phosphoribosylamino)uracil reductase RibD [Planctomycetaceae bacterium]